MSYSDDEIYNKMVSGEVVQKPCPIDESSAEYIMLPKCEHIEETLVVGEEIIVDENMDINQQVCEETICEDNETPIYFEEGTDSNTNVAVGCTEPSACLPTDNMAKGKWNSNDTHKHTLMLSKSGSEAGMGANDITSDDQDGDEETIATFVTAAGQQLALYAVEDSEEIFAVAVYDESGAPPTNFQFLMKADVERLIGEGAVRTVKKPTQMKNQLLTTQPPMFFSKNESVHHISVNNEDKAETESQRAQEKESTWDEGSSMVQQSDLNLNIKDVPNIIYTTANKEPDVTYLMMDDCSVNMSQYEDSKEQEESDGEIIEQSTVQYILFEGDQSDSELTFDEIQATLQNMKTSKLKASTRKSSSKKASRDQSHFENGKRTQYEYSVHNTSSVPNHTTSTLAEKNLNFLADRQKLLETLSDPPSDSIVDIAKSNLLNGSVECTLPETTQAQLKTKRSRKQQLISVNREDSEIIIQPASLLNEEENNVRKSGKRKRRVVPHSAHHQRNSEPKRRKKVKRKEVEVIEIDIDEDESALQSKRNVVEITLDDSKDKYSSDKENEIIMVGDSDDDSQQSDAKTTILQCQHCSRNFRQQRALETHLRVCSKSPSNSVKFNEQKVKHTNRTNNTIKKEYSCKICQEKFDVVVALARHVRSEHSQRKKRRYSKSPIEPEPESEKVEPKTKNPPTETRKSQLTMIKRVKRKKNSQRSNCSWEVKKLSCTDCGRWFPSAALLRAHCLQHETKKSEQQLRRCQVCKKLIKSRLLYIRHLKMHCNMQQNTKPVSNMQKKLHATRSVTRKITTLRKRGRPRKL